MKLLTILKKVLHLGLVDGPEKDWAAYDVDLTAETPESIAARRAALGLKDAPGAVAAAEPGEVVTPFSVVRAVMAGPAMKPEKRAVVDGMDKMDGMDEARKPVELGQGDDLPVGLPPAAAVASVRAPKAVVAELVRNWRRSGGAAVPPVMERELRRAVGQEMVPMPEDFLEMPKETLVRVIQMERMRTRDAKEALSFVLRRDEEMRVAEGLYITCEDHAQQVAAVISQVTKQRDEAERLLAFAQEGHDKAKKDEAAALASAVKCVANLKQARQAYVELAVECTGLTEENEALRAKLKAAERAKVLAGIRLGKKGFEQKGTKAGKAPALKKPAKGKAKAA